MPLARQLARRYYHGREPFDDLLQVAHLGLVKAADRFDVERSTSFASFAVPTILGELRRHFRDTGWAMRVPRPLQEQVLEVRKVSDRLFADTGRAPTAREIAAALDVPYEQILDALTLAHGDQPLSLDSQATNALDDEGETLGERFGSEEPGYELVEDRDAAADAIRRLPHLERVVLGLRFLHDMKQSEIATHLGCSQMQVSRLLRRALSKLAEFASDDERVPAGVA